MNVVLSIAGSDTSAGAGIQQDLKTMTAFGHYGATVITAITSQNTMGVQGVMPLPDDVVTSQIHSVLDDLDVKAIKIGQIPNAEVAHAIAHSLGEHFHATQTRLPIVYDPVMISTSGKRLMTADSISTIQSELFPLCTLITPNIPEAEHLTGRRLLCKDDIMDAGKQLVARFGTNILIKGGHAEGETMTDILFTADGEHEEYHTQKVDTKNLHGTGCTLSSAIACKLAEGTALSQSVQEAKDFVTKAIIGGKDLCIGHGNGPLWNF